ncbi:hypothetical protein [Streptomyces sp. NPDC048603]
MFGAQQVTALTEDDGGWFNFLDYLDGEGDKARKAQAACAIGRLS